MRLAYPGITLDLAYGRVERGHGVEDLSPDEVCLLAWLHAHADQWVPSAELLCHVWGYAPTASPRTVQAAIDRLLPKLEEAPERPRVLRTQPGAGYRLERPIAVVHALTPPRWDTPLVGRRAAHDHIDLATRSHRLVCVVGPPGVGKTRLVAEWAARRGAAFVDACPCDSADALIARLASASGVDGSADLLRRVAAVLRARSFEGLVLDGLDRIGQELEPALEALAARAPELPVVATSRRTPALQGAAFVRLGPLPAHDAMALWQSRTPTSMGDAGASRSLTELLGGLPQAMELAAGCVLPITTAALVDRMRAQEPPQRGVELAMAAAWEQLKPVERASLQQLTAFEGGFAFESAAAVLDVGVSVPPTLDALMARGLLQQHADPRRAEVPRAVQDWVHLEAGPPSEAVRERHAAAFGQEATLLSRDLQGHGADQALARLHAEQPNLTAAARWALDHDHSAASALVLVLADHARASGRAGPRALLQALCGQLRDPDLKSQATLALAHAAQLGGSPEARARLAREAHELAPADSEAERHAAVEVARTRLAAGDVRDAERGLREVLGGHIGRTPLRVAALITLGDVHLAQERLPEAQSAYSEAMKLAADLALVPRWAWATLQAAAVLAETGARPRALELLDRVIDTAQGHGLHGARPLALLRRARLRAEADLYARAVADLEEAEQAWAALGEREQQAHARFERGVLLLDHDGRAAEGALEPAVALLQQAGLGESPVAFLARLALVQAWLDQGRTAKATRELEALQEDPLAETEAFGSVLFFVRAVALALDGQRQPAIATAEQAETRFRGMGSTRAEVGATALLAHLTSRDALRDRLRAFPSEASPELAELVRLVHGGSAERLDGWLVRQLSRIPRANP